MKFRLLVPSLLLVALSGQVHAQAAASRSPLAPELVGTTWLNTPDQKPVTLAGRKGKVTLVAFWTFACSNCHANIPAYERLLKAYRPLGVELYSVHTPELEIERKPEAVAEHVRKFKIDYPVVVDNAGENWRRWKQSVWPTLYVIDRQGRVRYQWVGELNWQNAGGEATVRKVIDRLLVEKSSE